MWPRRAAAGCRSRSSGSGSGGEADGGGPCGSNDQPWPTIRFLAFRHLGDEPAERRIAQNPALLAQKLRLADARCGRPILCAPQTDLRAYSREVNLASATAPSAGHEPKPGRLWRVAPRSADAVGSPWYAAVLTRVQTQLPAATRDQQLFFPDFRAPAAADNEAIRLLTYIALTSGARGIEFQTETPLTTAPRAAAGQSVGPQRRSSI